MRTADQVIISQDNRRRSQGLPCLLVMLFYVCLPALVSAQKISTIISKDKIVLGEQVSLQIKIEELNLSEIQQDFIFPDTVNHIEILADTAEAAGNNGLLYTLVITSFDSGYWQLPAFEMLLTGNRRLRTEPVGLTVLPVDVSALEDYHDIKDILDIPAANNWYIVAAVVALALVSLFAFLWFVTRRRHEPGQVAMPVANLDQLYQEALKKLSALEALPADDRPTMIKLYKELVALAKDFSDAAFMENTRHLTTGEYMMRMSGRLPAAEAEGKYFQVLRLADAVKFAKYLPPTGETTTAIAVLRETLAEIYQSPKSRP